MDDYEHATQFEIYLLTERCLANNSVLGYARDIRGLVNYLQEVGVSLAQAKPADLKGFLRRLHDQRLAARSVSRKISAIKLFFSYLAERFGWNDAARDLQFPKLEKRLPRYLSEQEVESVLSIIDKDCSPQGRRNRIMVYLLYVTGMRASELVGLRRKDLQLEHGVISVLGKGGKQRMIPIAPPIVVLLREYFESVASADKTRGDDYLFAVAYAGKIKPISRQSLWMIIKDICRRARIKRPVSPHQLRHSLATHMLKSGANLRSLQLLLGHENLATVQTYTHVETSYLRSVYDKKHPRS